MKGKSSKAKGMLILFFLSIFTFQFSICSAETVAEMQARQRRLQEEIEQTNRILSQTRRDESATLNKLQLIERNIRNQRELIRMLDNEITALDREMSELGTTRDSLQLILEHHKAEYAKMIRESHYARIQQSPLLFLLSSESFQQLARRARYMVEMARFRQEQVRQIENTQAEIDIQNELLQTNKREKETALATRKREQEKLKRDERKQKTMLSQLKAREKELKKKLQKQQQKIAELNRKIDEMIRRQAQANATLTREQQLIAGGFEANKGRLPWPVERGLISGHFGKHPHPVYSHVTIDNKGIYLQTEAGAKARAVFKGEVTSCFRVGGTFAVIIQHGNYRTVYSNLTKLSVKQGDHVEAKQVIGTIFTDPEQDQKTELYFQIYKDRTILNPEFGIAR